MNDAPSTPTTNTPPNIDYDALAQQAGAISTTPPTAKSKEWVPSPGDPVAHVQTGDGTHLHVHGDDLAELQKRDPNAKVIAPPSPYQPDYDSLAKQAGAIDKPALTEERARSRTLQNKTSRSGQESSTNMETKSSKRCPRKPRRSRVKSCGTHS